MQQTLFVGGKISSLKHPHCLHVGRDFRSVAANSHGKCQFMQQNIRDVLIFGQGRLCSILDLAMASLQGQIKFVLTMLETLSARCNITLLLSRNTELLVQWF